MCKRVIMKIYELAGRLTTSASIFHTGYVYMLRNETYNLYLYIYIPCKNGQTYWNKSKLCVTSIELYGAELNSLTRGVEQVEMAHRLGAIMRKSIRMGPGTGLGLIGHRILCHGGTPTWRIYEIFDSYKFPLCKRLVLCCSCDAAKNKMAY